MLAAFNFSHHMMDEQQWKLKADGALKKLHQSLLKAGETHDFEADLGDALTVEFEEPRAKFVVSPNTPVRQIWVSAHSRSFKFDYDQARDIFFLPDTGQTLEEAMADAVGKQLGEPVSF